MTVAVVLVAYAVGLGILAHRHPAVGARELHRPAAGRRDGGEPGERRDLTVDVATTYELIHANSLQVGTAGANLVGSPFLYTAALRTDAAANALLGAGYGSVMNAIAPKLPALFGGSADLDPSTKTALKGLGDFNPPALAGGDGDGVHALDLVQGDAGVAMQDLGDVGLQLAVRHRHRVVERRVGVAHARQHVRDGVLIVHLFSQS